MVMAVELLFICISLETSCAFVSLYFSKLRKFSEWGDGGYMGTGFWNGGKFLPRFPWNNQIFKQF